MALAAILLPLLLAGGAPVTAPVTPASPLDTLLEVHGYRMHVVVYRGTRPVTVVMESGGGAPLDAWAGVERQLAEQTGATVVAYDRAGFGASSLGPADLTPKQQIRQLYQVLERLGTPPARILVGHSYGGLLTMLHAHLYPDGVRGVVLVDPMNPRFVQATGDFVQSTVPHNDHPATARDSAVARMVRTFDGLIHDPDAGDRGLAMPIVVISAGTPWWGKPEAEREWRASHQAIAAAGSHRRLVIADGARHDIPAQRPDVIVEAVRSLLR